MKIALSAVFLVAAMALSSSPPAQGATKSETSKLAKANKAKKASKAAQAVRTDPGDALAEARLIGIYQLIGQARTREALSQAESLVKTHPDFQLAQLVYGDLLSAQTRPVRMLGDVPDATARVAASALKQLREESQLRLKALQERPPSGAIPSQFLALSGQNRHAIAVDASRSRLYLFENSPTGLRLVADYYVSIGKSGTEKTVEGDLRTPLGIYFISSNLDPKTLKDFYGAGALPINYPNPLDVKRGKSGSGIWLHGTPPGQFARAPFATDGCVVLANSDLERVIRTVSIRTTPVVIASSLRWVAPHSAQQTQEPFQASLQAWRRAKSSGDLARLQGYYTSDFRSFNKTMAEWTPALRAELEQAKGRGVDLKDLSYLHWTDSAETMVVTFGEVLAGNKTGPTKRQYWVRQNSQWKIFFEGVIG